MNASHVIRALGISGLLLAVSACEDFSGADPTNTRQVVTEQDCYDRGGQITNHQNTNERVCVVPNASSSARMTQGQGVAGDQAIAAGVAGDTAIAAGVAVAGVALVTVFALSDSSSGTR